MVFLIINFNPQTQLLELKTSNYTLSDTIKRNEIQIKQLSFKNEDLEKELSKLQKVAKLNPLAFAQNLASRKDAKDKQQLRQQIDSQEEEFKITNETLKVEIYQLMNENDKMREWIGMEGGEAGSDFLKNIAQIPSPIRRKSSIASAINSDSVDGVNLSPQHLSHTSEFELGRAVYEKERLQNQVLNLQTDLKQLSEEKIALTTKYEELKVDFTLLQNKLSEAVSLAEERQVLIDAMHDNLEESRSQFKNELESLKDKLSVIPDLNSKIQKLESTVNSNAATIASLETEKNSLIKKVDYLSEQLKNEREEFNVKIKSLERKHHESIETLTEQHETRVQSLNEQLTSANRDIKELSQKVKDSVEERKIHDKKGVMMMRELKRTLAAEKKRAENLQDKLREVLNDPGFGAGDLSLNLTAGGSGSHSSPGTSTPVKSPSSSRDLGHAFGTEKVDTSSVGSWSFVSSFKNSKKRSPASNYSNGSDAASGVAGSTRRTSKGSPTETTDDLSETATLSLLESENSQLVQRITDLQQEKWKLEEKVNLLAIEVDSLKKDNEVKQQVIEYYCMEGRAGATVVSSASSSSNNHYSSSSASMSGRESSSSHINHSYHHSSSSASTSLEHHQPKLSVKKVVDYIKDKGQSIANNSSDHITQEREINKKLQRMLEETLTKNMSLQKDLESLAIEVDRLTKECNATVVSSEAVVAVSSSASNMSSSSSMGKT